MSRWRRTLETATPPLIALGLAIVMTWPLVLLLDTRIPGDLGDPLFFAWQLAWMGHAIVHQPFDLFHANIYWPLSNSLAFTDSMVGYAPAGIVATSPRSALLIYNLLYLFAFVLAFLGAYLLGRELGTGRLGGLCAGAAFAYAPWLIGHGIHLPIVSSGGIPLSLFLLLRGYRRQRSSMVFAGWLVAAWQMTLGLAIGLPYAYLLAALGAIVVTVSRERLRSFASRRVVIATVAGVFVLGTATFLHVRPYLEVLHDHPEAGRYDIDYVRSLSPTWRGFLAAPEESFVWADATSRARVPLRAPAEQSLFPGLTISALALVGLLTPIYSRRLRVGLGAGIAFCAACSIGITHASGFRKLSEPYRLLFAYAPGWDGVRTPGRINVITALGLALLAAAGAAWIAREARRFARPAALALVALIAVEGFGPPAMAVVPPPPIDMAAVGGPRLHLPQNTQAYVARYAYWSIDGLTPIVNGDASTSPTEIVELIRDVTQFPDAASIERLRAVGVTTVVLHRDFALGTPWESAAERSIAGLPVTREVQGDIVIFRIIDG